MPPKKAKPATCDLCCEHIKEGKEEALHCEGGCGLWFHRYCAGVSSSLFKELAGSPEPFLCYICYQRSQHTLTKELKNEVAHLKSEITKLSKQLAKLSTAGSAKDSTTVSQPANNNSQSTLSTSSNDPSYAATLEVVNQSATTSTRINRVPQASNKGSLDKKFNVVMYGLGESPKGSPRHERISYDVNLACKIIKSICPNISDYAICDCSRIGPYSEPRTRPLIVKFSRSYDVASVLSNRHRLPKSEHPNVYIKSFMSFTERKIESTLLKERRALIDSGVERSLIKIRGNSIYVNRAKVGSANEDGFIRHKQHNVPVQYGLPLDSTLIVHDSSNASSTCGNQNGTIMSNNAMSSSNTNNAVFTYTNDSNNALSTSNTANALSTSNTANALSTSNTHQAGGATGEVQAHAGSTSSSATTTNQD